MRIHPMIGFCVKAHGPNGALEVGVVVKAQREQGRGMVLTLDTGASIVPRDVIEKIGPAKSFHVSTYCNFAHSMSNGAPIKHECRYIPPSALRLEHEGLFTEATAIMEGRRPCKDCTEYAPVGADYCDHCAPHTYHVFKRCAWKPNPSYPQGWEPFGGADKETVARGVSLAEAKRACNEANEGLDRSVHGQTFHEFEQE